MTVRIVDEGECERCHTPCSREPGEPWYNFYGRDQCKLDPDEGPHIVPVWHQAERETGPQPVMAEVVLWGLDASGQPVEVARQQIPSPMSPGKSSCWTEVFTVPAKVTGWEITVTEPGDGGGTPVFGRAADAVACARRAGSPAETTSRYRTVPDHGMMERDSRRVL